MSEAKTDSKENLYQVITIVLIISLLIFYHSRTIVLILSVKEGNQLYLMLSIQGDDAIVFRSSESIEEKDVKTAEEIEETPPPPPPKATPPPRKDQEEAE